MTVGTMVMHESGEWIEYDPICLKPVKNDPQAVGSTITYAKRYALSAIFGITSDNDDDGNEATQLGRIASKTIQKKQVPTTNNKIPKEVVKAYKDGIQSVIDRTGRNDGSITRWFCEKLGVVKIEDITMEQISLADGLLKFQSTHPCGVRPQRGTTHWMTFIFQSTHPCGVRHRYKYL